MLLHHRAVPIIEGRFSVEHRMETCQAMWQRRLFLPRRPKRLACETASKVTGAVFRVAAYPCLSRTGFGGDELKVLGKPETDSSHSVTLGVNEISGQKEF